MFDEMIHAIKTMKGVSLNQSHEIVKIELSELSSLYIYRFSLDYGRAILEHWNTKHDVVYMERHVILHADSLIVVSNHSMHVITHKDDHQLKWYLVDSYELRGRYAEISWIK